MWYSTGMSNSNTTQYQPGDRIMIQRKWLGEKRPSAATVRKVNKDGTLVATVARQAARGRSWVPVTIVVKPGDIVEA